MVNYDDLSTNKASAPQKATSVKQKSVTEPFKEVSIAKLGHHEQKISTKNIKSTIVYLI